MKTINRKQSDAYSLMHDYIHSYFVYEGGFGDFEEKDKLWVISTGLDDLIDDIVEMAMNCSLTRCKFYFVKVLGKIDEELLHRALETGFEDDVYKEATEQIFKQILGIEVSNFTRLQGYIVAKKIQITQFDIKGNIDKCLFRWSV